MTAATLGRTPARGFDRLVLSTGLALVAWSRKRAAHRVRVVAPRAARFSSAERSARLFDPYSADAVHSHGIPPTTIR